MLQGNFIGAFSFMHSSIWFNGNSGRDKCTSKSMFTVLVSPSRPRPTAPMNEEMVMGSSMSSLFLVQHAGESKVWRDQALPPNLAIASSRRLAAAMANVRKIRGVRQQRLES